MAGGGRGGCAPSYSVDSCLQWSNGVWWVKVLSYHVLLSSSGMYCLIISSAWLSTFCRLRDRDGLVRIGQGGVAVSLWVFFFKFDQHYLLRLALNQSLTLSGGFSQATALLAIAAADYKNEKKKKKCVFWSLTERKKTHIKSAQLGLGGYKSLYFEYSIWHIGRATGVNTSKSKHTCSAFAK